LLQLWLGRTSWVAIAPSPALMAITRKASRGHVSVVLMPTQVARDVYKAWSCGPSFYVFLDVAVLGPNKVVISGLTLCQLVWRATWIYSKASHLATAAHSRFFWVKLGFCNVRFPFLREGLLNLIPVEKGRCIVLFRKQNMGTTGGMARCLGLPE
jgi:hypothetical protein